MSAASSGRTPSRPSRWCWCPSTRRSRRVSAKPPNALRRAQRRRHRCPARRPRRAPRRQVRGRGADRHSASRGRGRARPRGRQARVPPPARRSREEFPRGRCTRLHSREARALTTRAGACASWRPLAAAAALRSRAAPGRAGGRCAARTRAEEPRSQHAIEQAECFADQYDSAVWYKMMEPRLRKRVKDRDERMEILKNVFCEAQSRRRGAPAARAGDGRHPHREPLQPLGGLVRGRRRTHAGDAVLAGDTRHAAPPADEGAGEHPHGLRDLPLLSQAREQQRRARAGALQRQRRQALVLRPRDRPVDALERRRRPRPRRSVRPK